VKERFSKASVTAEIQRRIDAIQSVQRFDPGNGYAQVIGEATSKQVDYGTWSGLCELAEALELPVDPRDPRWWKP
jgi:hypothetical protein